MHAHRPGPDTELAGRIRADREIRDQNKHRAKLNILLDTPLPDTLHTPDRPPMHDTSSFEGSATPLAREGVGMGVGASAAVGGDGDELNGSEIGDGEESVAGHMGASVVPSPAISRGRSGKVKAKAKPRKSKLAQEIVPLSADEGQEVLTPPVVIPVQVQP